MEGGEKGEGREGRGEKGWNSGQRDSARLTFVCLPIMYSKRTFLKYCKERERGREKNRGERRVINY